MDIFKYRKYITNNMNMIIKITPWRSHQDVDNGLAYWLNETILVYGYRLKTKFEIIKPVYSFQKEILNNKFNLDFSKKYQRRILAIRRRTILYLLCYIRRLPLSIIRNISEITY